MGAAAHVGGWFLAPPPSLVKFRTWVCKTASPLECEKISPIRILRFQRRAVCPVPCQEAAAATRSRQGDRKDLRRQAGPPVLSPTRGPQQAPGAAREAAGASAAGPVTFNARRDYELLEQVVSTYGR